MLVVEWLVPATESPSMPPFRLSTTSVDEEHMARERVGRGVGDTGKKTKTGKDGEEKEKVGGGRRIGHSNESRQ